MTHNTFDSTNSVAEELYLEALYQDWLAEQEFDRLIRTGWFEHSRNEPIVQEELPF